MNMKIFNYNILHFDHMSMKNRLKKHKKGLRQCAKLHDFGGAVIVMILVVKGQ